MPALPAVSASDERKFQNKNILAQKDRYLATDVMRKVCIDSGYAEKIHQVEAALGPPAGLVLDIGANTCGESEFLTTRGYPIVCTDINEVALGLSQERCRKFQRKSPVYMASDGHSLPLQDECVQFAIFNESLHHMESADQVLREVQRVLTPGGRVFLYEPYAYNPYRRLSEIRDRFLGTIERSFGVTQLRTLLGDAGLLTISVRRHTCAPSTWRKQAMSATHRVLKELYFSAAKALPRMFGNLVVLAEKPGTPAAINAIPTLEQIVRCPVTGARLLKIEENQIYLSLDQNFRGVYPTYEGIPVLMRQEAVRLDPAAWRALQNACSLTIEPQDRRNSARRMRARAS